MSPPNLIALLTKVRRAFFLPCFYPTPTLLIQFHGIIYEEIPVPSGK